MPVTVANDLRQTVDPPRNTTSDSEPDERRMIGDFNNSANDLWTLFGTKVKSHDDAQIKIVKDKMDTALVFVRSNSVCAYCKLVPLISSLTGWFIFRCPHRVPN